MTSWPVGADIVEELIAEGRLGRLRGASTGVTGLMDRARQQLLSATEIVDAAQRLLDEGALGIF